MDTPIRDFPLGGLRVSDAERDQAVAELSDHYQAGRLTVEEFEDRSGLALQARTGDELSHLFTDLPRAAVPAAGKLARHGPGPGPRVVREPRPVRPVRPTPVARIVFLCVIAAVVTGSVLGNVRDGHGGFGLLMPVIVLAVIFRHRLFGRR